MWTRQDEKSAADKKISDAKEDNSNATSSRERTDAYYRELNAIAERESLGKKRFYESF